MEENYAGTCHCGRLRVVSGQAAIGHYAADPSSWPKGEIDHGFCTRCGTQLFSRGYLDKERFNGWFHAVNASVLEGVSPETFDAVPEISSTGCTTGSRSRRSTRSTFRAGIRPAERPRGYRSARGNTGR